MYSRLSITWTEMKVSINDHVQYLTGWPLSTSRCCKQPKAFRPELTKLSELRKKEVKHLWTCSVLRCVTT